jgi:hypothetical protein
MAKLYRGSRGGGKCVIHHRGHGAERKTRAKRRKRVCLGKRSLHKP